MWLGSNGSERVQCTIKESINIDRGLFVEKKVFCNNLFTILVLPQSAALLSQHKIESQIKVRKKLLQ